MSFSDIARLRLDANRVVLSACETASRLSASASRAVGQESGGNALLEGLVRLVLATYWPISNAGESEKLIAAFYGAARKGTIGDALKVARTELIASPDSSNSFFWGAFFLVGDAQKPLLTGAARAQMVQSAVGGPFVAPAGKQVVG